MQPNQIIKLGENIEVQVGNTVSKSKLQDILRDGRLVILQPTNKLVPVRIAERESVEFVFFRPDGMYSFSAVMEESIKKDNLRLCVFKATTEVERIQRRNGFRLPVVLNVIIHIQNEQDEENGWDILGKTVNLSDRGALISTYKVIPLGTKVTLQMRLEKNQVILTGDVVRFEPSQTKTEPHKIAISFVNCSRRDLTHVGRFILRRQIHDRHVKE